MGYQERIAALGMRVVHVLPACSALCFLAAKFSSACHVVPPLVCVVLCCVVLRMVVVSVCLFVHTYTSNALASLAYCSVHPIPSSHSSPPRRSCPISLHTCAQACVLAGGASFSVSFAVCLSVQASTASAFGNSRAPTLYSLSLASDAHFA